MKEEGAVLSWFEDTDFSHVKKPNVSNYKGQATTSATLSEDYVKDVKDAKPISADYQKYTLQDVYDGEAQNKFNVISTFAGGGGSSTGYRLAGGKILCINEFVEEARNTYHENFPNTPIIPDDIKCSVPENIIRIIERILNLKSILLIKNINSEIAKKVLIKLALSPIKKEIIIKEDANIKVKLSFLKRVYKNDKKIRQNPKKK